MGSFHRSLTVLLHYRSKMVFRFGKWSSHVQTDQTYSALLHQAPQTKLLYGTGTLYGTWPLASSNF